MPPEEFALLVGLGEEVDDFVVFGEEALVIGGEMRLVPLEILELPGDELAAGLELVVEMQQLMDFRLLLDEFLAEGDQSCLVLLFGSYECGLLLLGVVDQHQVVRLQSLYYRGQVENLPLLGLLVGRPP